MVTLGPSRSVSSTLGGVVLGMGPVCYPAVPLCSAQTVSVLLLNTTGCQSDIVLHTPVSEADGVSLSLGTCRLRGGVLVCAGPLPWLACTVVGVAWPAVSPGLGLGQPAATGELGL